MMKMKYTHYGKEEPDLHSIWGWGKKLEGQAEDKEANKPVSGLMASDSQRQGESCVIKWSSISPVQSAAQKMLECVRRLG